MRTESIRRLVVGLTAAGLLTVGLAGTVSADTAASGNGGSADASADGGGVVLGDANSGGSTGTSTGVGDVAWASGDDIAAAVIAAISGTTES